MTGPAKIGRRWLTSGAAVAALIIGILAVAAPPAAPAPVTGPGVGDRLAAAVSTSPGWDFAGKNVQDTHYSALDHSISPAAVGGLVPRWVFTTTGAVSATPTVDAGAVYVPDWGGTLSAINATTGRILWRFPSGGSVIGGAAIVAGSVYWGSGYHTKSLGLPYAGGNDKLYAFSLPTL